MRPPHPFRSMHKINFIAALQKLWKFSFNRQTNIAMPSNNLRTASCACSKTSEAGWARDAQKILNCKYPIPDALLIWVKDLNELQNGSQWALRSHSILFRYSTAMVLRYEGKSCFAFQSIDVIFSFSDKSHFSHKLMVSHLMLWFNQWAFKHLHVANVIKCRENHFDENG